MTLKAFSTDDLYYLLDVNHSKEIRNRFGNKTAALLFKEVDVPLPQKKFILSRAFFSAITEGPSCSIVILWSIIGLVSLNLLALSLLTLCFAGILLVTGGMFFYATYNEQTRENKKSVKQAHLADLKLRCANEIFLRQKQELKKEKLPQLSLAEQLFNYELTPKPLKTRFPHLKKSIGATLLVTPTLFGTYYFAASGILSAFGLTAIAAFMTGPIGISIAIAVALCVGIYFGYTLYQACKQEEIFNRRFKKVNHEIDYKRKLCYEQKNKLAAGKRKNEQVEPLHSTSLPLTSPCNIKYSRMPVLLLKRNNIPRKHTFSPNYFSKRHH